MAAKVVTLSVVVVEDRAVAPSGRDLPRSHHLMVARDYLRITSDMALVKGEQGMQGG